MANLFLKFRSTFFCIRGFIWERRIEPNWKKKTKKNTILSVTNLFNKDLIKEVVRTFNSVLQTEALGRAVPLLRSHNCWWLLPYPHYFQSSGHHSKLCMEMWASLKALHGNENKNRLDFPPSLLRAIQSPFDEGSRRAKRVQGTYTCWHSLTEPLQLGNV